MTTIMFRRGKLFLVADIIQTVLEPLDEHKRQVVYFCQDKAGKRYRVPKGDVVSTCIVKPKVKAKKKKKKCCA